MRVIYNQGDQRISVVPINPATGAPVVVDSGTDVTVSIVDLREHETATDRTVLATTTVAQDTFSAVLTAAAGFSQADPHALSVITSTAALGRPYLLTSSGGQSEVVRLASRGLTSASTVTPLRSNYAAADTLRGVELVATFPSAEANDEDSVDDKGGPYLVTWTYVVDGLTVTLPTTLWVDRFSLTPPIDESYVIQGMPTIAQRARGRVSVSGAIAVAWDDWLASIQSSGKDPSLFPPAHNVKVALRELALAYLVGWVAGTPEEKADARADKAAAMAALDSILEGRAPQGQVQITRETVESVDQPKGSTIFSLS